MSDLPRPDRGGLDVPGLWAGRLSRRRIVSGLIVLIAGVGLGLAGGAGGGAFGGGAGPTRAPVVGSTQTAAPGSSVTVPSDVQIFGGPLPGLQLIVADSEGQRLLDASRGTLGPVLAAASSGGSRMFRLPGGGFVCACVDRTFSLSPSPSVPATASAASHAESQGLDSSLVVTIRILDESGRQTRELSLPPIVGTLGSSAQFERNLVNVSPTLASDGRTLIIGWVASRPPVWKSGLEVVDLLQPDAPPVSVPLPDRPLSLGGAAALARVPDVAVSPDGRQLVVSVPGGEAGLRGTAAVDRFTARAADGRVGSFTRFPDSAFPIYRCMGLGAQGFIGSGAFFDLCQDQGGSPIRRVDLTGATLGETALPADTFGYAGSIVTDAAGATLFAWSSAGRLTRVDLATGRITGTVTVPGASRGTTAPNDEPSGGPTGGPLKPTIAISPDRARLYVLGGSSSDAGVGGGGASIWALDAGRLLVLGRWSARADLGSIAVSPDGRYVVALGTTSADSQGATGGAREASLSVYAASTGQLRLFAAGLPTGLTFQERPQE